MGSVSGPLVMSLIEKLKGEHVVENVILMENITPNPDHITQHLLEKTMQEKYDLAVALDGDGHRAVLADSSGIVHRLDKDPFKALCSWYVNN